MIRMHISNKKINFLIFFLFIFLFFIISLTQVKSRYNLNQQIAISDRILEQSNIIYPNKNYNSDHEYTVSQYFPGMSLILSPVNLINNYNFENFIYTVLAISFHLFFIIILSIVSSSITNINLTLSFCIIGIFSILITKSYLFYSLELKPDSLSYSLGLLGLYLFNNNSDKNHINIFFYGLIFGFGFLFKQQYISFILGSLLFLLLNFNIKNLFFNFGSLFASSAIILFYNTFDNFWFWNAETFKDDGFMKVSDYINGQKNFIFSFISFYLFIFFINFNYDFLSSVKKILFDYIKLLKLNYTWVLVPSCIANILSGIKVGGNTSNTGLALLLAFPIIFNFLRKFELKWIYFGIIVSLAYLVPSSFNSYTKLKNINNIEKQLNLIEGKNNILYGSPFYRMLHNTKSLEHHSIDYWTHAQREGIKLQKSLKYNLENNVFEYLIIEDYMKEYFYLYNNKLYKIIFENNYGFIAKKL